MAINDRAAGAHRVGGMLLMAGALLAGSAASAWSQPYQQESAGKLGRFDILRIYENGRFSRCAASTNDKSGMLRIAFGANRQHYLSIPSVEGSGKQPLRLRLDGSPAVSIVPTVTTNRAAVELDYGVVDKIMATRQSIEVAFAGRTFRWDVSGENMERVIEAVANCTSKAAGTQPIAPPPQKADTAAPQLQGKEYMKAGNWTIERYTSDAGGRNTAFCAAFLLTGSERGVRIVLGKNTFQLGFSGLGSAANDAPIPVTFWFDRPNAAGELPVQAPLVEGPDTFPWRTVIRETSDGRADDVAKARSIAFSYKVDGKGHVERFPLAGIGAALGALKECVAK